MSAEQPFQPEKRKNEQRNERPDWIDELLENAVTIFKKIRDGRPGALERRQRAENEKFKEKAENLVHILFDKYEGKNIENDPSYFVTPEDRFASMVYAPESSIVFAHLKQRTVELGGEEFYKFVGNWIIDQLATQSFSFQRLDNFGFFFEKSDLPRVLEAVGRNLSRYATWGGGASASSEEKK